MQHLKKMQKADYMYFQGHIWAPTGPPKFTSFPGERALFDFHVLLIRTLPVSAKLDVKHKNTDKLQTIHVQPRGNDLQSV